MPDHTKPFSESITAVGRMSRRPNGNCGRGQVQNLPSIPTKLPNKTAKICPHCFVKYGISYSRKRRYTRTVALHFKDIPTDVRIQLPRISSRHAWWNPRWARMLIAPPDLVLDKDGKPDRTKISPDSFPWFICHCIAECPRCGPERVVELDYARQFGESRLVILAINDRMPNWREVIFSHE